MDGTGQGEIPGARDHGRLRPLRLRGPVEDGGDEDDSEQHAPGLGPWVPTCNDLMRRSHRPRPHAPPPAPPPMPPDLGRRRVQLEQYSSSGVTKCLNCLCYQLLSHGLLQLSTEGALVAELDTL